MGVRLTLSDFRTWLSNELGLDNDSTTEQPDIDRAVNQAVLKVLEDTRCYVKETAFTGFDGTSGDYTMDSGILEIIEVYLSSGGTNYQLERISVTDLIERRRAASPAGSPTMYYALNGANMLMFYPPPGTSDTLHVYSVPVPTALSASGDDPSDSTHGGIPAFLDEAIFYYAAKLLASYDDDATSAQGQRYQDWYDKRLVDYRKLVNRRGGILGARAQVNAKRRRRPYHDNSVYPSGRW